MAARSVMLMMGVAALAAFSAPAGCQSEHRTTTRWTSEEVHGSHRVRLEAHGEVRFTDDDRGIAWISPGGRVTIEETGGGEEDRRAEFRPDGGGVSMEFYRDGRPARPDASDRAWLSRVVGNVVRESGHHAPERVARIRARGGVSGVLRDVAEVGSDGAKRLYYSALLRSSPRLTADETARTLAEVGERIGSDGDKRMTLAVLLERGRIDAAEMVALLDAAGTLGSDGDRSMLLRQAVEHGALDSVGERQAFFRATRAIGSDGDKARVLTTALEEAGGRRDVVIDVVRTARGIGSDGDKARVLTSVPGAALADRAVRSEMDATLRTIGSDGDRARVATWMARTLP